MGNSGHFKVKAKVPFLIQRLVIMKVEFSMLRVNLTVQRAIQATFFFPQLCSIHHSVGNTLAGSKMIKNWSRYWQPIYSRRTILSPVTYPFCVLEDQFDDESEMR